MVEKMMVDVVVIWVCDYKVDGFCFDFMGYYLCDNLFVVWYVFDVLMLWYDGVDGKVVYLYGEGWNFGEVVDNVWFY